MCDRGRNGIAIPPRSGAGFRSFKIYLFLGLFLSDVVSPIYVPACPFCAKFTRSTSDDVRDSDAVAFGLLSNDSGQTLLKVLKVIRPHPTLESDQSIRLEESIAGADREPIKRLIFLRRDLDTWKAQRIDKATPSFASYLAEAWQLFDDSAAHRMAFFFRHLNDPDPKIAADAYAEFAKASFRSTAAAADVYDPAKIRNGSSIRQRLRTESDCSDFFSVFPGRRMLRIFSTSSFLILR